MKELKLSFVMPVYNEQCNIAESIRSLLNQTISGEIIVIDDASTDATPDILKTFGDKITVITNKERRGAAWCRNYVNEEATGDIIVVCDAEIYNKDRSECIHEFFVKNEDYGVFYSGYTIRPANNIYQQYQVGVKMWDFNSKTSISHPTVAYRKSVVTAFPYHEVSKETDMFEAMLFDMHDAGIKFGACNKSLMLKIEGNSNRDKTEAKKLKQEMYDKRGIEVEL